MRDVEAGRRRGVLPRVEQAETKTKTPSSYLSGTNRYVDLIVLGLGWTWAVRWAAEVGCWWAATAR
jgi:hypothetical protein